MLHLGAFVVLNKYVGVTFSGQRRHVGTAPTPPLGYPAIQSAYRFNVVCYPKDAAVDGLSRFTLASLPGKKAASSEGKPDDNQKEGKGTVIKRVGSNVMGMGKGMSKGKGKGVVKGKVNKNVNAKGRGKGWGRGKAIRAEVKDDLSNGMEPETEPETDDDWEEEGKEEIPGTPGEEEQQGCESMKEKTKAGKEGKRKAKRTLQEGDMGVGDPEPLYITPEMINMGSVGLLVIRGGY